MTVLPHPVPTDERLAELARRGNDRAFDELVRRHEHEVYRLAYRLLQDEDDAAGALTDTFLAAYRGLDGLGSGERFAARLYRIATHASLMRYRMRRDAPVALGPPSDVREVAGPRQFPDWAARPPGELLTPRARAVMAEALQFLPLELRTVFVLRDLQGLSSAAAGEILGLKPAAVRARLHRARVTLRARLDRHFVDEWNGLPTFAWVRTALNGRAWTPPAPGGPEPGPSGREEADDLDRRGSARGPAGELAG